MKKPRSKKTTTKKNTLQGRTRKKPTRNLRGKTRRKTTRKKGKGLGDASNASFVQGGNQIQTFVLLFVIVIIILFLLPNVNKMFDYFTGKKPTTDTGTDPTKDINVQTAGVKPNIQSGGGSGTRESLPTNFSYYDLQRWLLTKAGFYNGTINMANIYNTENALVNFSKSTGVGVVGQTPDWNPLIINYLRNKGVLNGYARRQPKRLNGNQEKPRLLKTPI